MNYIRIVVTSLVLLAPQVQASYMQRATRLAPAYAQMQRAALRPGVTFPVQQNFVPQRSFFGGPSLESSSLATTFPTREELQKRRQLAEARALGYQHRDTLARRRSSIYGEEPLGDVTIEEDEPFVIPTAQEVITAIKEAIQNNNAAKIMEIAEWLMLRILDGEISPAEIEKLEALARKRIEILEEAYKELAFEALDKSSSGLGGFWTGYSMGKGHFHIELAFRVLYGIGFYAARRFIDSQSIKNAQFALEMLLKVTNRAKKLLAEKKTKKI
ncbi:MAG: hypothetical protein WC707_01480 [Candidatus Babeliaceae bacterium]|jgi:hypothetical protein